MNTFLVIYHSDKDVSGIRSGLDHMRVAEHISSNSSIVLSFRDAEEILKFLDAYNADKIPVIVIKLDSVVHTRHIDAAFFEPNSTEHL